MSEAKTETQIINQIDAIFSESTRMKEEAKQSFFDVLIATANREATRQDITIKMADIKPQVTGYDDHPYPTLKIQGVDYKLGRLSFGQYLGSGPVGLRQQVYELLNGQPVIDQYGQKIEGADMGQNYLNVVPHNRPRAKKVFRVENGKVAGLVGENYPLWWSDAKALQGIMKALESKKVGVEYRTPTVSENTGTLDFGVLFPDMNIDTPKEFGHFGMNYKNNAFGGGVLSIGGEYMRQVCTNGMMIKDPLLVWSVNHSHVAHFNKELIRFIGNQNHENYWLDEPVHTQIKTLLLEKEDIRKNTYLANYFYEEFARAAIEFTRESFARFKELVTFAMSLEIEDYKAEIEAQAEVFSLSNLVPLLITLAEKDSSIDTDDFNLWSMSQVITRLANSPEITQDRRLELQQVGYQVITRAQ